MIKWEEIKQMITFHHWLCMQCVMHMLTMQANSKSNKGIEYEHFLSIPAVWIVIEIPVHAQMSVTDCVINASKADCK